MLLDLLIAIGGMIVLISIWTVTQILVRRQMPDPPEDGDVLARRDCDDTGTCRCGITSRLPADRSTSNATELIKNRHEHNEYDQERSRQT